MQKIEARVAADEDLKLADLLKYYLRESQAAKVLLLLVLPERVPWLCAAGPVVLMVLCVVLVLWF